MIGHLFELLRERAAVHPEAVAVGGQSGLVWKALSGREMLTATETLAAELVALGVGEGDRVVLWLPNTSRTLLYFFALWKLGAIAVPFDREMNPEAGERILASVEPRMTIVGYAEQPAWAGGAEVTEWWEPGARGGQASTEVWRRPAQELAAIVFTSGTTGNPKGCMITQANLLSQLAALRERIPLDANCRLATILPLSHLLELTGELYALSQGAALHYVPSRRGPDIVRVLKEQRITHMIAVPQLLTMMGRALDERLQATLRPRFHGAAVRLAERLPLTARHWLFWPLHWQLGGRLKLLLAGGAALPLETQRLWERFGVRVIQGYGTSECSPVVTLGSPDGSTPPGSVGRPIERVEVKLSPEGELLVRGPNVMRGYWNDPLRTAEVIQDGWYATGDLARLDELGNVTLIGRAKDLIVLPSGLLVWPEDVEDVLRRHPAVKDAAVLAAATPGGGAVLHAYLLPSSPEDLASDLATIVALANGQLAQHQRLATASWWTEVDFPRTSLLKVRRHLLPPPERGESVLVASALAADDPIGQAITGLTRQPSPRSEQTLGELGLDSLGLVDLALALEEKTGQPVEDGDLRLEMTVAEVRKLMAGGSRERAERAAGQVGTGRWAVAPPLWPYTWGRVLRVLGLPWDLLLRLSYTRLTVLGSEHLRQLPPRVILAGTHHSFTDTPLVRAALFRIGARDLAWRLVPAIVANPNFGGLYAIYGILALGLHPLSTFRERDASLRALARVAGRGNVILIFPQGTHATPAQERADDPEARFRPGVAYLASALEAAVIPFGLAGTERMIRPAAEGFKGLIIAGIPVEIKRGPLAIAFGPPLRMEAGETTAAFAGRLQRECFLLTRQAEAALQAPRG